MWWNRKPEAYFILYCYNYDNLRNVLLKEFGVDRTKLCKNNELEVLNLLLNPVNRAQTTKLSKYSYNAIELRGS